MSHNPNPRTKLLGIKLAALVKGQLGRSDVPQAEEFGPGAALRIDDQAWVLLDEDPIRRLGSALAWMQRAAATSLAIVADSGGGVLARRAVALSPEIMVWKSAGRDLVAVTPDPVAVDPPVPANHEKFRAIIAEGGAEPVVEWGVLAGEVRGLEVCRVVQDPYSPGEPRLEIGIGEQDRQAFQMMHGNEATPGHVAAVVAAVAEHRRVGGPPHPMRRLASERLLRWHLTTEPSRIGFSDVQPVAPPVPRAGLGQVTPAVAHGVDANGDHHVVVCSVGVDLELVPVAADAWQHAVAVGFEPRGVTFVTPERDWLPVAAALTDLMKVPTGHVVPSDWS